MKFQHVPAALLWSERHLAFHRPLAAGGKIKKKKIELIYLQSHIYKNIPVSYVFITTWNQGHSVYFASDRWNNKWQMKQQVIDEISQTQQEHVVFIYVV